MSICPSVFHLLSISAVSFCLQFFIACLQYPKSGLHQDLVNRWKPLGIIDLRKLLYTAYVFIERVLKLLKVFRDNHGIQLESLDLTRIFKNRNSSFQVHALIFRNFRFCRNGLTSRNLNKNSNASWIFDKKKVRTRGVPIKNVRPRGFRIKKAEPQWIWKKNVKTSRNLNKKVRPRGFKIKNKRRSLEEFEKKKVESPRNLYKMVRHWGFRIKNGGLSRNLK